MDLELPDVHEKPSFSQFIQWGFYTAILVLAAIVSSSFVDLKNEVVLVRTEMSGLNAKVAVILEKNNWYDRELARLHGQIVENEERIKFLERRLR